MTSMSEAADPAGKAYPTQGVTVWFDKTRCLHFAECVRGLNDVFQPGRKPWVRPELGDSDDIARVIRRCPTGALHYRLDDGAPEEPEAPTQIRPIKKGPLLLRGDLLIKTPAGPMRDTRAALCACGATTNTPFCDGACEVNPRLEPRE